MARPTKLNKTLQSKLVKLLRAGVSIADACAHVGLGERTFYDWMARGESGEDDFSQFSQDINRARNNAKVTAIDTLHSAAMPYKTRTVYKEHVVETRLKRNGEPYDYRHTSEHETINYFPGDWRAAVEHLKRRYPDEWSEKRILELGLSPELLERLEKVAKDANVPASVLFENMINAVADQLQLSGDGRDSADESPQ